MTHHLSTLQVQQLCVSALPEDELVAAAVHTTECQSCNERFVEELKRQRGSTPLNFTLEPEFWFQHDHVDFDQLVALADKTLDQDTEEIINIHLKTCESCREDVRSFLAFRNATAREKNVTFGPIDYQPTRAVPTRAWWQRLQTRAVYAVAAIVLVAIAILIGVIALNSRSGPLEANKQDHQNPDIERTPNVSSSPAPSVVSSPSSGADSEKVAILKDSLGEVTIAKNGRITGLDELPEKNRQYIARAVVSEQVEPPDVLRHLSGEQSGLRGNDDGRQGFRLMYPVRRVVIDDRPLFRWESLPGVSSYGVYVLDANGNQVGESEELPPTKTQWKAPAPLPRGQVFSWTVIAVVDGKKVASPSASAPEMKFAVLSAENFQELTSLKKSNSHLALGVYYARAGLLNEAEREFHSLLKLNPQSELARKLLQSVRSIRKAN
jgi:hypothetical protein